jgi:acetyl esterase/lipase
MSREAVTRRALLAGCTALAASACSRLGFFAVNAPAAFGAYRRVTEVAYGQGPAQHLDVYLPERAADGPRPVVVFWYGGRWSEGDKADYKFVGAALAGLGYVCMIPNYRHYPAVKLAGFMDDAALAAAWAFAHAADYGADAKRLFLMGHSAGAHMAALLALDGRYLAAHSAAPPIAGFIGLSGPYDFLPLTDPDLIDMFGPPENFPRSQPITFALAEVPGVMPAGPRTAPMLLIHGLADDTVWPKNSINLATALERKNAVVTLKLYPKLKHADTVAALSLPLRARAPTLSDIAAFVAGSAPT